MLRRGFATPEGTERFRVRFEKTLPGHHRLAQGLWLSSVGLGTYLGEPTAEYDELYRAAVVRAAEMGTNVFDSAINYRHQRSERSIGKALGELFESGRLAREEVFLATKGGFLTFDGEEPPDPANYFYERFVKTGLMDLDEVAAGCHVMSPKYLLDQLARSRQNLGVETIDLYYIHNPETQLTAVSREEFYRRLRAAFEALEAATAEGKLRFYGTATWTGYRVAPETLEAISLEEVLRIAREVGGENHHFRAIQLPFNMAMPEALGGRTQSVNGKLLPALEAARAHGLMVFASASLMQGNLTNGLPEQLHRFFPGLATDAQRALQFVRSTPGITTALVGMSQRDHIVENLSMARVPPMSLDEYRRLLAG
jgi:aryl-alcohol dehydrogenase-like predicted oxidoreductase